MSEILFPVFLPDLVRQSAQRFPTRVAIDFLDRRITYEQLWARVQRLAANLQAHGLKRGARVGLMLPNTPAYIEYFYAVLLAGGVVVNINPLYAPHELEHILHDSDPHFVVTLDLKVLVDKIVPHLKHCQLIAVSMANQLPFLKSIGFRLFKSREVAALPKTALREEELHVDHVPLQPVTVDLMKDVAVLQYTGGTTGTSKAAMLSHANLAMNAQQCRLWFGQAKDGQETALAVIPFFHAFALTSLVNLSVMMGTTIISLPRFDVRQVIKTIAKKKPTIFPAVPTIFATINQQPDLEKFDLRSVNYCISGGAPLPIEVKQEFEHHTGCVLVEGYGLSETSPVVCANPLDGLNKPGTIGKPLVGTHVKLVSLEDSVTQVPLGEKGELCVRGPQLMLGYWNRSDETAKAVRNGWLHTGDVAIMDSDGYLAIVDRIKDMILCGGYNVYPRTVEEAVYRHPAIAECVCAGLPDPVRGEMVKIWITLKPNHAITVDELRLFLKDYLSPIEMPKVIDIRDTPLPKTLIGKLSRKALLDEEKGR
jgi:long-chain acyl-CoA synthetase